MNDTIGDDVRAAGAGAVAGTAATAAMSVLMVAARETGIMSELPPHEIADDAVDGTPAAREVDGDDRRRLGWLLHFAFGAATGAVYGVLRNRVRTPGPAALHGVGFGLAVWAVSYLGWIPALHILPTATEDEPGRPPTMLAAHVVFGAILGSIVDRALRIRPRGPFA